MHELKRYVVFSPTLSILYHGQRIGWRILFWDRKTKDINSPAGSMTVLRSGVYNFGINPADELVFVHKGRLRFQGVDYTKNKTFCFAREVSLAFEIGDTTPLVTTTIWRAEYSTLQLRCEQDDVQPSSLALYLAASLVLLGGGQVTALHEVYKAIREVTK